MATQEFYLGSVGPLTYEDTDTYPDAETLVAFRGPQIMLADAPTADENVMRKSDTETYVTTTITNYVNIFMADVVSFEDQAVFFDDNIVYNA